MNLSLDEELRDPQKPSRALGMDDFANIARDVAKLGLGPLLTTGNGALFTSVNANFNVEAAYERGSADRRIAWSAELGANHLISAPAVRRDAGRNALREASPGPLARAALPLRLRRPQQPGLLAREAVTPRGAAGGD